MATKNDILTFARHGESFSVNSLLNYFQSVDIDINRRSLYTQLRRMVDAKELKKLDRGLFIIAADLKSKFHPFYNGEMKRIAKIVSSAYPFLDRCIWSIDDIKRLSHYASNRDVVFVEVDRDAVEGVFNLLSEKFSGRRVFLNPSESEYSYYINGTPSIIVKPLVTEAPCIKDKEGITHPSIEKIMVDVISDVDFTPWQDFEAVRLFDTIFTIYEVATSKLMRYARRRGKSDEIEELVSKIKRQEE